MHLPERVLFVHAHPDDETLSTGAAIAHVRANGGVPLVLTLTLGEQGEQRGDAVPPHALPALRAAELDAALAALGAEPVEPERRFRDSGMEWGADGRAHAPASVAPDALSSQPVDDVADVIAAAIVESTPDALVTYDDDGGYGHPDHVATHRAAVAAAARFGLPVSVRTSGTGELEVPTAPVRAQLEAALDAHASQLQRTGDAIVHVGGQRERIPAAETYRSLEAHRGPRILTIVLLGIVAALIGAIGTFTHQSIAPWGLVLALVAAVGALAGARLIAGRRAAIVAAVCMLAVIVLVATDVVGKGGFGDPRGVFPADVEGWLWLTVPAVAAFVAIAWPTAAGARRIRLAAREGARP